jgi:copper chaperone CopZ
MQTINLTVSGMTCSACVKHVEKAIKSIVGGEKLEIDLASGSVKIEGDVSRYVKEILAALEEDGYPAQVISDDTGKVGKEKSSTCKSGTGCCCS